MLQWRRLKGWQQSSNIMIKKLLSGPVACRGKLLLRCCKIRGGNSSRELEPVQQFSQSAFLVLASNLHRAKRCYSLDRKFPEDKSRRGAGLPPLLHATDYGDEGR